MVDTPLADPTRTHAQNGVGFLVFLVGGHLIVAGTDLRSSNSRRRHQRTLPMSEVRRLPLVYAMLAQEIISARPVVHPRVLGNLYCDAPVTLRQARKVTKAVENSRAEFAIHHG